MAHIIYRPWNATCVNIEETTQVMNQLAYMLIVTCCISVASSLTMCTLFWQKICRNRKVTPGPPDPFPV